MFPTVLMRMRDPGNVQRAIRERRDDLSCPKLSTHSFRKACTTIRDRAGLSAAEVADYLGHENPSLTQDVYMNTLKATKRASEIISQRLSGLI